MVKVLARLGAAWPQANISEPTQRVWMEHLARVSFPAACDAVRELEVKCRWYPSISEFSEVLAYQAKARAERQTALPASSHIRAPKEVADRYLAEMSAKIAAGRGPLAKSLGKATRGLEESARVMEAE